MRGLAANQIQEIEKVTRRRTVPVSDAMLEKDLLVRDAIEAVCRAGDSVGAQIVFCGGTALSQAHNVIERMSEDADFRIVVPEAVTGQNAKRRFLSAVKAAIQKALEDIGFPLVGEMKGRNGNEYIMGQFAYQSAFMASDGALRPHIKLEITAFEPISAIEMKPLRTILDRIGAPQKGLSPAPLVPVVSIADTVADKIVGYLRRTAQDQAGLGRGAYDDRLVRHLYDVYAI
ncbi:nucleotidyl transferase AbiEii/AbiGii toxin family protein [Acidiferrobacter sp.]|uniref:nucleotidyl transferase AbiEii/AbiGii toxin family protein n=1 Tax=Acidiferrobacter sp. TaxID=1872107 RepID=UPI002629944A|nr:nucleotidyl transferase AbiEii/AbiGii toxin family protein [Acidiferrobacter sp.]